MLSPCIWFTTIIRSPHQLCTNQRAETSNLGTPKRGLQKVTLRNLWPIRYSVRIRFFSIARIAPAQYVIPYLVLFLIVAAIIELNADRS